jgi:type IV pilus biogenesis protein CpaD/CtpE
MKRSLVLAGLVVAVLGGCAVRTPMAPDTVPVARTPMVTQLTDANGAPIEKVPFVSGVSSKTVEKLAAAQACTGGEGAALVTPVGPVEVYRVRCENGRVFMARCELRQCKQM